MKIIYFFLILLLSQASCKKDSSSTGVTSLNIIQACIDMPTAYLFLSSPGYDFYSHQISISYGASSEYSVTSGINTVILFDLGDTTKPFFQQSFQLNPGKVYSLYLAGQFPTIDTLFLQDTIPIIEDSLSGVRFVNLSNTNHLISINLVGSSATSPEFVSLEYKQCSSFKTFSGANGITSYNFEIRDQTSGNLLMTFNWNLALFRNSTLVINGSDDPSSSVPINIFQVNNY